MALAVAVVVVVVEPKLPSWPTRNYARRKFWLLFSLECG